MKKLISIFILLTSFLTSCATSDSRVILELKYMQIDSKTGGFYEAENSFSLYISYEKDHIITDKDLVFLREHCKVYAKRYVDRIASDFWGFFLDIERLNRLEPNYVITSNMTLYYR